jgi:hypothetical protein
MRAEGSSRVDWRDSAAYAPLLRADRSLFAWEWLRRDARYAEAALAALPAQPSSPHPGAAHFGLIRFESPHLAVPQARPIWSGRVHPHVLSVTAARRVQEEDAFDLGRFSNKVTLAEYHDWDSLLLCDGLRAVRIDAPAGTFREGPLCLRYHLEGLVSVQRPLLTLHRFLALCRGGAFSSGLHKPERRARRWILMLRAYDALASGASQREIAMELFSRTADEPLWRSREPSVRSQAQRLVRSVRHFSDAGYRGLLS